MSSYAGAPAIASAENRSRLHVQADGMWVAKYVREPDAQSPAGRRTPRVEVEENRYQQRTPAMAVELTDHVWSIKEWISRPSAVQ